MCGKAKMTLVSVKLERFMSCVCSTKLGLSILRCINHSSCQYAWIFLSDASSMVYKVAHAFDHECGFDTTILYIKPTWESKISVALCYLHARAVDVCSTCHSTNHLPTSRCKEYDQNRVANSTDLRDHEQPLHSPKYCPSVATSRSPSHQERSQKLRRSGKAPETD